LAREDLPSQCSPLRFHHRSIGIGWEASISFFEALAAGIDAAAPRPARAKGGRPPYPTVLMVKILVLQQLYNLADDALEYQLLDRRSFLQFLDLTESSGIPDAKTIWLFRDRLAQAGAGTLVFEQVQQQLQQHGYMARCGQIVDASLVQAPVQRNKREEADIVKEGTMPLSWKAYKRAQKDVDARWTKKHGKSYFGYKLHTSVDKRYKLLRKMVVTHAAVADTTVFEPLLDLSNTSRDVYADRGYPTAEREATLKQAGWRVHIQRKGSATKGISEAQKKRNRRIATPRARRTCLRRAGANGRQAGALHGHRPCHLHLAPQGGKLQPETAGVSEGRWFGSLLSNI
jgi:IS5 family transposase